MHVGQHRADESDHGGVVGEDAQDARSALDLLVDTFEIKIGPLMDEAKTEVLAFTAFVRAHWTKIWSTNGSDR